jgi:hypothetical protein
MNKGELYLFNFEGKGLCIQKIKTRLHNEIAKKCALKKGDIGKLDTRSCIGTIDDEGRIPYDHTKKARGKLD